MFVFLDNKVEDKKFCTEWQQAFPGFNLFLISYWIEFWFIVFGALSAAIGWGTALQPGRSRLHVIITCTQVLITLVHKYWSHLYTNIDHTCVQILIVLVHKYWSHWYTIIDHTCTQILITPVHKYWSHLYTSVDHTCTQVLITLVHKHWSLLVYTSTDYTQTHTSNRPAN
jgi:hypothetical protein